MRARDGLTRRQALGAASAIGVAGAAWAVGLPRGAGSALPAPLADAIGSTSVVSALAATCSVTPEKTEGPFWVDEGLERSDITGGETGVPLTLTFYVYNEEDGCSPVEGAVVDIWHANALGEYSDINSNMQSDVTTGQTWLRGYQVSDSDGKVVFETIFPGWYQGRAIHIHARVRFFDGTSTTYDFTSQVFFDPTIEQQVKQTSPYTSNTQSFTANSSDSIYANDSTLIVPLTGNTSDGYAGTGGFGLTGVPSSNTGDSGVGSGNGSGSGGSGSSSGSSSTSGSSSGSSSGTTTTDSAVSAKLLAKHWHRNRLGKRTLWVTVSTKETVSIRGRLYRSDRLIGHKSRSKATKGHRVLKIPVGRHVHAGKARLKLVLKDRHGNDKTIRRTVHVPHKLKRKG